MIHEVSPRLVIEAEACALRFACEDCAHFAEESGRCSLGYPNEDHRALDLRLARRVVFCKFFELL